MNKLIATVSATAALFAAALTAPVHAAPATYWSTTGAGCVPAGQTTQGALNMTVAGRVKFNTGKTGLITLTCPISAQLVTAQRMKFSYLDPDGVGTNSQVIVTLRNMNRKTGAVSSVLELKSNAMVQTTFGVMSSNISPTANCGDYFFDHDTNFYYIEINMSRTTIVPAVEFGGVALEWVIC